MDLHLHVDLMEESWQRERDGQTRVLTTFIPSLLSLSFPLRVILRTIFVFQKTTKGNLRNHEDDQEEEHDEEEHEDEEEEEEHIQEEEEDDGEK